MGGPIRFYQSNHLRVIFFCIATGIPILVSAVSVFLWCVYEFTYTAKGKKAYGGKKKIVKKTVTRLVENIAAENPLRDCTPNPEATAYYRSKTTLSWADGWASMCRKRKWGWLWDKLGLLFIFTQRQLLGLLQPARSRGRSRQDANLAHSY